MQSSLHAITSRKSLCLITHFVWMEDMIVINVSSLIYVPDVMNPKPQNDVSFLNFL